MTAEEDRREPPPGRRLTDNQLLAWRKEGEVSHAEIERDIQLNHSSIAELVDELTAFRSEAREQFKGSRIDRDALKAAMTKAQAENRSQFAGIGECISELKAWQHSSDQQAEADRKERDRRQTHQDVVYQEIVDEFKFRRRMAKWRNSFLVTTGMILGLIISGHSVWEMIKHLFEHPQP